MKKRILSLILAVITVLQVCAIAPLPIIAEDGTSSIPIEEMEVGKLYTAVWDYELPDFMPSKLVTDESGDGGLVQYPTYLLKEFFPQELTVMKTEEDDFFLYVTNEDWGSKEALSSHPIDEYRYVESFELIVLAPVATATVTYKGEPADKITLHEGGSMPLRANAPEGISEKDVTWSWQILVGDRWVTINDRAKQICNISYALVVNVLDENDEAQVRTVAHVEDKEYPSSPVTVKMKYARKPIETEYENDKREVASASLPTSYASSSVRPLSDNSEVNPIAEGDVENIFTLTVNFVKVLPDGTQVRDEINSNIHVVQEGYEAYPVTLRPLLGYYPSMTAPSNPYDFTKNPEKDPSFTSYTMEAGKTADFTVTIYYYPGTADYKVYHYLQNIDNDQYPAKPSAVTAKNDTVDRPVPDGLAESFEGFQPLYYERTAVAVDGSTIIEIYYEREYFSVTFDLVHTGAYGQEDLYVKYEYDVTLNPPSCAGWTFGHWVVVDERGNEIANSPHLEKLPKLTVTDNVIFRAVWTGSASSYKVLYWIENANDGNYSIAYQEIFPETSGRYATWNGEIPAGFIAKMGDEYQFFSLNSSKTEEENRTEIAPDQYVDGVIVEGDGSTNVNVYFARRFYEIEFVGATPTQNSGKCGLDVHTHGDGTCEYNAMFCTHAHSSACSKSCTTPEHTHIHTAGCKSCEKVEHIHTPDCCGVHVHNTNCYSVESDLEEGLRADVSPKVSEYIDDEYGDTFLIGSILPAIIDYFANEGASNLATEAAKSIQSAAPPQNLQNGYVYVLKDQKVPIVYDGWLIDINDTIEIDIPAIYIDGEWYYYNVPSGTTAETGMIVKPDSSLCDKPDREHTGGCDSTRCSNGGKEHVHSDKENCYSCGQVEHEHTSYCTCSHEHTADCYGYRCMKPEHTHTGDGATDESGYKTIRVLQAKYGQDITEYVPYFLELSEYGLQQNANGAYFTYWKYDSTGTDQTQATDRYVKHVTMVPQLCYSAGIRTVAQYSSNVSPYVLYYLFESFDQESGVISLTPTGAGRDTLDGNYYDSDPIHTQYIMLDNADAGALDQLNEEGAKEIEGFTFHQSAENPKITTNVQVNGIPFTRRAYFYDRNTPGVLTFYQTHQAVKDLLYPDPDKGEQPISPKYGAPLGEIAQMLKDSGVFDIENPPYPADLEPDAYDFVGWYTTRYETDYTKVDWATDTFPNSDLPLYAVWAPTRHTVYVYEDYTMTEDKLFTEDNGGIQLVPHGYRTEFVDYSQSSYADAGYTFNGWYYIDPKTNERTRFLLASMPVTQDMKIFAEWKMDARVPYRINFVHKHADGTEHAVADSIVGTALVGQSKTFRPYGGLELYADYQEGFFPEIGSHTLQMMYEEVKDENGDTVLDENGKPVLLVNEFTFYYMEIEKVNYTIHYVDEDGNSLHPSETLSTRYAAVTERFIPISGYTAEDYAISLIISATEPEKNVITFRYKENEKPTVDGFWFVNYIFVHADGTREKVQSEEGIEPFDPALDLNERPTFAGSVLDFSDEMFRFSGTVEAKTRALVEGELVDVVIPMSDLLTGTDDDGNKTYNYYVNEYGIELDFYYEPMNVGYDIVYKVADSDDEFARVSVPANESLPHGYAVDVTIDQQIHMNIVMNEGCQLIDPTKTTIKMYLDPDESRNEIVFLYQEFNATFDYIIVCDDLENSGVRLSHTTDDIPAGSDALPGTPGGLKKVYPYESSAYYFAGWFADQDCTRPLDESYPIILEQSPYDADDQKSMLTPTKTEVTYTVDGVEHTGSIYVSTEYYALFLPRSADLTVTVNGSEGDTFLLTLVGDAGTFAEGTTVTVAVVSGVPVTLTNMPIGTYTVTSNESWSWRYERINTTATVATSVGGNVTISASIDDDRWLTDDAMGIVPTS